MKQAHEHDVSDGDTTVDDDTAKEIKRIDPDEFMKAGYLQEINRLFLHPLGMALEVIVDDKGKTVAFGGVWDYRDDPEGIVFGELCDTEKAARVRDEMAAKKAHRQQEYGWEIQPVTEAVSNG